MKLKNKVMTFAFLAIILSAASFSQVGQDNSKINERDNSVEALTADQQKENQADTQITSRIRQDVMKDKSVSTYAKNVKIITINGQVTLKGPVRSMSEQNRILKYARSVAGVSNVINEMAIAPEKTN